MEKSSEENKIFCPFYTLRVYERHEIQVYYKGNERLELRDEGWKRFNRTFDINWNIITNFREYVLFDSKDDTGTRCIKVAFQDETYVYAAYSWEAFEKWFAEIYVPIYSEWDVRSYNQTTNNNISDATT